MRATHNLPGPGEIGFGSHTMARHEEQGATEIEPRQGRRRSRLTPEQRAYREARRRANLKMSFAWHFVAYGSENA